MKEWTVDELIAILKAMNPNAPVRLEDASSGWTILKFSVEEIEGKCWFNPSNYTEMSRERT